MQQKELNSKLRNKMEEKNKTAEKEKEDKKPEKKEEIAKPEEKPAPPKEEKKEEIKKDVEKEKKSEPKKPEKPKKTEAHVQAKDLPISTKYSAAVCRFIKNKKIENAIADLELVLKFKKSVPMKGEIPHRKGKGMMSGRFPKNTTEKFIKLLKSLSANASYHGLEEPIIVEAIANIGSRPYGRFGRVRKKRTHVKIVAKTKQKKEGKKKEEKK